MHADLVARSRTGDRVAFGGLVALWADRALQVALQASRDADAAATAVSAAFVRAYLELPSRHRSVAFRPWLLGQVLRACDAPPRDERLRAVLEPKGLGAARKADRALSGLLGDAPRLRLPDGFYEERVAPQLVEPSLREATRAPVDASGWRWAASLEGIASASGVTLKRRTRSGGRGRGALPKPWPSGDSIEVAVQTAKSVGWVVRSHVDLIPGDVEASYDASWDGKVVTVRLRGVALPEGVAGKLTSRVAERAASHRTESLERASEAQGRPS